MELSSILLPDKPSDSLVYCTNHRQYFFICMHFCIMLIIIISLPSCDLCLRFYSLL